MNTHQRLNQIESKLQPSQDGREPLLLKFIDSDPDTGEIIADSGILYTYGDNPKAEHLDRKQVEAYEATGELIGSEIERANG